MKTSKKTKMILGISLGAAFLATITASLTWFDNRVNLNPSINGGSAAAYFAYGKGTKDEPYGITTPRHLYNLAWLQYIGKFDSRKFDSTTTYFELAADIDMDSTKNTIQALPPIGNSNHPFIGQFTSKTDDNGNYHTIKNLTISNSYSDFGITPYSVTNTSYTSDNIVGMFGVVGDPTADSNPDTKINNFYLDSPTIKSTNSHALAGIVAGYVNAEISSVGVITPAMSFPTTNNQTTSPLNTVTFKNETTKEFNNVSDYSVVGYCEDAYKSSISSSVTKLKNTNVEKLKVPQSTGGSGGGQADWGGSVGMREMYNGLLSQVYNKVKSNNHQGAIEYTDSTTINSDGTIKTTQAKNSLFAWINNSSDPNLNYNYPNFRYPNTNPSTYDSFSFYEDKAVNSKGKQTASYAIISKTKDDQGNTLDDSAYLSFTGYAKRSIIDGNTIKNSSGTDINKKLATLFYESSGTTNYYFKAVNTTSLPEHSVTTDSSLATPIIMEDITKSKSNDKTYIISFYLGQTEYYFSTVEDSDTHVVSLTFSTVKPDKDNNGQWKFDNSVSAFYSVSHPGVYFALNSEFQNWGMYTGGKTYTITDNSNNPFIISYDNKKKTNYKFTNKTDTGWTSVPIFMNDGCIYINENTKSGNTIRYVKAQDLGETNQKLIVSFGKTGKWFTYSGNKIYVQNGGNYYYPVFNSTTNNWDISSKDNLAAVPEFTIKEIEGTASFPFHYGGPNQEILTSFTVDSSFTTPDTYFPLQGTDENIGIPKSNNTGYVVGGTDYYGDFSGDFRVSKYSTSGTNNNLSASYSGNQLNTVYSINTNGETIKNTSDSSVFNSFIKYESSKQQLTDILNKDTNVYGIHFMNGTIGKRSDNTYVTIPSATINGVDYSDYQVPDDCIDFTLKTDGNINFFAGTYYDNNNSFFSLYKVERDSDNKITALRKIKAIYSAKNYINWPNGTKPTIKINLPDNNYTLKDSEKIKIQYENESTPTFSVEGPNATGTGKQTKACTGECVFDISNQLESPPTLTEKVAYYFEIPITAGEYALGSVNTSDKGSDKTTAKNGAYLIYLDIGTNSGVDKDINRTIISEYMETTTTSYTSFMGVCILSAGQTNPTNYNSYCVQLKSAQGDITFTGSTTDKIGTVTTSVKPSGTSTTFDWISVSFKKNEYTVKYKTNETTSVTMESTTKPTQMVTTTKRVTYYDYSSTTKVTNIVQVTTTGEEKSPSVEYYEIDSSGNKTKKDKLFFANLSGYDLSDDDINNLTNNTSYSTENMLSFEFDTEILGTINITFNGNTKQNADGYYSIDSGYDITISGTNVTEDTTIMITNIKKNSTGTTYTITINNVDTGKQESITITLPASQP